ncbi:YsnF/AvaK domain-containing protein [Spirosoma validum]|uniref:YsnF/AvaK domain-containing protein n=1 Tax=Spirosoma validum TaxID=2771355 RepID=A0A927B5I6_9BACT|nr:YsnF/AvaK domain-containing protein [Spirosoma validum]MBD2755774.1 YsnF/AvaK domain-containing protein [Spirosoma validum]
MNPIDEFGQLTDSPFSVTADPASSGTIRIPLIEEQLQVGTQTVETGRVTLTKTVHETDEVVTVPLQQEEYAVERIALNQYVNELPITRQEGDTTIYPVVKEVLVVQKRLLLVEEIRVTRQQTQTEETQTVRLRREDITVERTPLHPERPV